ncbi:MAG: CinA family nicotinamide mononucleotide deamidase-related protein [Deltaproteobacteria bacterium]
MNAEIIAIGSELLLGQIVDTNSSYIAASLAENGIELVRTSAVGDDFERMEAIIKEAIARSSIIITTGGLGPTEDDLTREVIAHATGRPLVLDPSLLEQIEAHFKRRGYRMTENNRKQANIPQGAIPIENPKGTAPAFIVEGVSYVTLSLPGVPLEMKYLMESSVVPYLRKRFNLKGEVIQYRVLRTCGLGESGVGLQIADLMRESKNPTVGTLASPGDVRIRITAKADHPEEALAMIQRMESEIRRRLGTLIYGMDDETLQGNIAKELDRLNLTLSVVETFTGGTLLQKLTSLGHTLSFQGIVLPSTTAQRKFLELGQAEFDSLSMDSKGYTDLLSRKVCTTFGTTLGLAQWANALESSDKEHRIQASYSLSTPGGVLNEDHLLGGEMSTLRERVSIIALDMVRKYLLNVECGT